MFAALEFEHRIGRPQVRWIVIECAGVGRKCGGWQTIPPRRDIAYFCSEWTARRDAEALAEYKNSCDTEAERTEWLHQRYPKPRLSRNQAFEWDHQLLAPLLKWGVLQWSGDEDVTTPREDIAYFLDGDTAEADARAVQHMRDFHMEQEDRHTRFANQLPRA